MSKRSKKKQQQRMEREGGYCHPLHLYKMSGGIGELRDEARKFFKDSFVPSSPVSADDITSDALLPTCYDAKDFLPYRNDAVNALRKLWFFSAKANMELYESRFGGEPISSAYRDLIANIIVVDKWGEYKQIYVPDADFVSDLVTTENIKLYPHLLRRLPYECFYVDFSKVPAFDSSDGAFVWIKVYDNNSIAILVTRMVGDIFYPFYWGLKGSEVSYDNGVAFYSIPIEAVWDNLPKEVGVAKYVAEETGNSDIKLSNDGFREMFATILQLAVYLSSKEPDITLSDRCPISHASRIQGSKSVEKWDVGFRYGSTIRMMNRDASEHVSSHHVGGTHGTHRSPRPHSRGAHWQHYWTGKGRTNLELRWKSPVLVGIRDDAVATYHKVTQ